MNFKALLLDLDGTLLNVDMRKFIPQYIAALAPYLSHLIPEKKFGQMLLQSTRDVIVNTDASKTNEEVFFESFCSRSGYPPEVLVPIFDEFYRNRFPQLKSITSPNPESRSLLMRARQQGLALIIATNPIFPRVAIEHRLHWASISDFPFELVTALENMHFCKPNVEYYQEVIDITGYHPRECLMVGNDAGEDMVASKIGMQTFLVENEFLINPFGKEVDCHFRGSLTDMIKIISS